MSRALKENDVLEMLKLYEAEFNRPDVHDRILVFDVVAFLSLGDAIPDDKKPKGSDEKKSNKTTVASVTNGIDDKDASTDDKNESEEIEKNDASENDEKETGHHDCEGIPKYENGYQKTEINTEDEMETRQTNVSEESSGMADENKSECASQEESRSTDDVRSSVSCDKKNENSSQCFNEDNYETSHQLESEMSGKQTGHFKETSSHLSNKFIRQHRFYIHSSWLAIQSSYFRSLFFGGMKESNSSEVHIQISTREEEAHLMLLEAMYKIDILDKANVHELLGVLKLCDKYDVKFVFKKCKYCLQAAVDSLHMCEQITQFIKVDNDITDVEDLVRTLQSFLAKEFSPLDKTWHTTAFLELNKPSLKYLLSSDELIAHSENTIFHALVQWIEQTGVDNSVECQELPSLLSLVRFKLMTIDYLYNIVQHNSVAKKFVDFNEHYIRGISYHALPNTMKKLLPYQQVSRKASTGFFMPYTWVIPSNNLDIETKQHVSDRFWFCGYAMVLVIGNLQKNSGTFAASLGLVILNLKEESEVRIEWRPESQSFTGTPSEQSFTFQKIKKASWVTIRFKMPVNVTSTPFARQLVSSQHEEQEQKISTMPCLSIDAKMKLPGSYQPF